MALQATYIKREFKFGFSARTSRGPMANKTSWFIKIFDENHPDIFGIGECGPLPGLSIDYVDDFEDKLRLILNKVTDDKSLDAARIQEFVSEDYPSIRFGLETAWLDFINGGRRVIYANKFLKGSAIPINGLIWMGDLDFMIRQIDEKIAKGFTCIKLKVGGLDFDKECEVLRYIREKYIKESLTIRLDANGAFKEHEALEKLKVLSRYHIHSIEQPIKTGSDLMRVLCTTSPIPVALDEELIGVNTQEKKEALLTKIYPSYVILKPTLHGGMEGCKTWIELAQAKRIGWWITSALESNIGLNAICQFTANYQVVIPQGLGTGMIYENNIESPLVAESGRIYYNENKKWDLSML